MARLHGPLWSEHAHGAFTDGIQYETRAGVTYARVHRRKAGNTKQLAGQHALLYQLAIYLLQRTQRNRLTFRFLRNHIGLYLFFDAPRGQNALQFFFKGLLPDFFKIATLEQLRTYISRQTDGTFQGFWSFPTANALVSLNSPWLTAPVVRRIDNERYLTAISYYMFQLSRLGNVANFNNILNFTSRRLLRAGNHCRIVSPTVGQLLQDGAGNYLLDSTY